MIERETKYKAETSRSEDNKVYRASDTKPLVSDT
jgi:hypothetical protein